jgi:hypothetical protein
VGIVFKGSGWYVNDSRKSSSATVSSDDSAGKAEKAPAGDTAAKSEAKSETNSEAKSEPAAKSEPKSETKSSSESKPTT